jgi:putative endonuclease
MLEELHVYVLFSDKIAQHYTGSCRDLANRLYRHNAGESKSTKHGVPWRLIHFETYQTRSEAIRRERYLKTG